MGWLVDTNVLLRWALRQDPLHPTIRAAILELKRHGEAVYVTPQNIIEFWNAATRPANRNGFGYAPERADHEVAGVRAFFLFAPDVPAIFEEWLRLARAARVSGVQVHDTRLAAVMRVHQLTHLLTLNPRDFTRFPGITVVAPENVMAHLHPANP